MGLAAEAAWCAYDQGQYLPYEHALYENQGELSYTVDGLTTLATDQGLDTDAFSACLSGRTHRAELEQAVRAASAKGINSTPTFFINNQRIEGNYPYDTFVQAIEKELAAAQ